MEIDLDLRKRRNMRNHMPISINIIPNTSLDHSNNSKGIGPGSIMIYLLDQTSISSVHTEHHRRV